MEQPDAGAVQSTRLWGGRFEGSPSVEMDRLNRSLPVDHRLWREDIEGSLAWATALGRAEVLTEDEASTLREGLEQVAERLRSFDSARWHAAADEDIHTLVERLLREQVGAVAGRLHTGRSRNDQVATDTRLWALRALDRIDSLVRDLQAALLSQAEPNVATVMPSYTHLQRAQPIAAAHWLLSHAWALSRDRERIAGTRERVGTLPLGSGAIAGCPFPIDREFLRDELGFLAVTQNSIDAVGDRDWVAEILFVASTLGVHLSRLAEDVILFASAEFGFVRLADTYSTGSSLMPQKRNPDAMELARGKAGRFIGGLVGTLALLKGLPTGYNKDLQEDKVALFDAVDELETLLPAVAGSISTMTFDVDRCAAAVDPAMLATDLADFLVREGIPFREAHERIGRLVRAAEELGCSLSELPRDRFIEISKEFADANLDGLFDPLQSLEARSAPGGTAGVSVRAQMEALKHLL
ncbi:MAG: argininosuccinate lyase [Gemmatimonas sp.]|nr:argininosuccinate lyase [Gemmatimonas sp.]